MLAQVLSGASSETLICRLGIRRRRGSATLRRARLGPAASGASAAGQNHRQGRTRSHDREPGPQAGQGRRLSRRTAGRQFLGGVVCALASGSSGAERCREEIRGPGAVSRRRHPGHGRSGSRLSGRDSESLSGRADGRRHLPAVGCQRAARDIFRRPPGHRRLALCRSAQRKGARGVLEPTGPMRTYLRWLQVAALSLAVAIAAAFFARLLLSPATGEIMVLASARQPDRIGASTVELHSASGWLRLGDFNATGVPAAPGTATLVGAKAPIGTYDAIRLGGRSFPATISVRKTALETVLVAVSQGLPAAGGVMPEGRVSASGSTSSPAR